MKATRRRGRAGLRGGADGRAAAPRLGAAALAHVADYFRALSEPLRLCILDTLRDRSCNVGELTALLRCSQANVSKHLATLTRLGFVERLARGTSAYYRIADPHVYELCDLVCGRMAQRYAGQARMLGHAGARPQPRRSMPRHGEAVVKG